MVTWDKNKYEKWIISGCPTNDKVTELNLSWRAFRLFHKDTFVEYNGYPNMIENFVNLKKFYCSINDLTSLNNVTDKLIMLEELYCSNNVLTTFIGTEMLTNLTKMFCDHNSFTSLHGINIFTNLIHLYCSFNYLRSLDGIQTLTRLEFLDCSNNKLESLDGIENLANLKILKCNNNFIATLNPIQGLTQLAQVIYYANPVDYVPPNIERTLNTMRNGQNIYKDNENVHNHSIQESIKKSIMNILKSKP